MKTKTYAQAELAKQRAETFTREVLGDDDRADDFEDMDVEDYAEERGFEIENPKKGKPIMAQTVAELRRELRETRAELRDANERIEELEEQRVTVLDALGVELVEAEDEDEDEAGDEEEEEEG